MATLEVKQGETTYLIYDVSDQSVHAPSTASGKRNRKFSFLCGTFEKKNFIYATKFAKHPWHYFDELDSISSQHSSLPASMDSLISKSNKVKSIDVNLNEEQSKNYYDNGKFIFKNKELKTHMQLANKQFENEPSESKSSQESSEESCQESCQESSQKLSHKSTTRLLFISGQTNPLLFLNAFEKCSDLKTDEDKMCKIRHFVDEDHRVEFTKLYLSSDWPTVRSTFLKMYSLSFVENKKRELHIDFNEASTLRSFIERKLMSLSEFTTLPFINQMEIIMNDLPIEISSLFITNEKMTSDETEILDFCDSIQDLVETMHKTIEEPSTYENDQESNQVLNQMEIFDFKSEPEPSEPSEPESMSVDDAPQSSHGRGRGKGLAKGVSRGGIGKRGRPSKKLKLILEDDELSGSDFLNQMDNSSLSSWSDAEKS